MVDIVVRQLAVVKHSLFKEIRFFKIFNFFGLDRERKLQLWFYVFTLVTYFSRHDPVQLPSSTPLAVTLQFR